jgi:hypothetical protein
MKKVTLILILAVMPFALSGCLGFIVGSVVDVGIAVAKVPFKVTKAAVDAITDDDDEKDNKK